MVNSPALCKYCTYREDGGGGEGGEGWLDQDGGQREEEKKNMTNNTPRPDKRAEGGNKGKPEMGS